MDRERMIEKAARAVAALGPEEEWPTNDALGGHAMLGTRDDEYRHACREQVTEVLDAVLPLVSTVAELEALSVGTILLDSDGDPWKRHTDGWLTTATEDPEDSPWVAGYGPLTVVWQP